jgi:16S rRNA (cytosine1407-C5)-methyltransferase
LQKRHNKISENVYEYLTEIYGESSAKKYLNFVQENPSVYVRVNSLKTSRNLLVKKLSERYGIVSDHFDILPDALKFNQHEEDLGKTLEIALGHYYIQGFSSMLPPLVLNPSANDIVLDLCSAPGSKTTQIAEMMLNKGTLIVNDVQLGRIKALVYNLDRLNIVNTGVIHSKGEILSKYFENYFDKILVDAPCSSLGIMQKKAEVNKLWSLEKVNRLHEIQVRLLVSAIKMLKAGGEIVYSTCTLSPEENELVINKLLKKYPIEVLKIDLPIQFRNAFTHYKGNTLHPDLKYAVRILPWEADSDGFFMIKLRKTDETIPDEKPAFKKSYTHEFIKPDNKKIKKYLSFISERFGMDEEQFKNYNYILKRSDIFFINKDWQSDNLGLFHRIGIKFGTIDKRDNIVFHTNAAQIFEPYITRNIYRVKDKEELRIYLAGQVINNNTLEPGQYVIKYNDYVLGTAVVSTGGIKSRFPRSKRTQKIRLGNF